MLPKIHRFDKKDFSIVFNSKHTKRVTTRFFTLLYLKDNKLLTSKVGVILAKKKQKKAIDRNTTKRLIMSFFYRNRMKIKSMRLLYISNNQIKCANRVDIWKDLQESFKKLN